jgi:hypothetical protein
MDCFSSVTHKVAEGKQSTFMEELKTIVVKIKRDVLSDVVSEMKKVVDDGMLVSPDIILEIANNLSQKYGE